jgi:hypothetical protein
MSLYPDLASKVKNRLSAPGLKDFAGFLLKLTQYTLNRMGMTTQSNALSYLSGNHLFEERKTHITHFAALARRQRERENHHVHSQKIDCCVLAYYDFDTIRQTLEFLSRYADRLDITVIENISKHTEGKMKPYLLDKLAAGDITKYVLLDENIAGSAMQVYTEFVYSDNGSPYLLVTDGDLTVADPAWLDEELTILRTHDETFVCALDLDLSNLPLHSFPEAGSWVSHAVDRGNYLEGFCGAYLLLFKKEFFLDCLKFVRKNGLPFIDSSFHKYALQHGLTWARTKKAKAHHITWDLYADLNHEYTRLKTSASYDELWNHSKLCGFTVYQKDRVVHHEVPEATPKLRAVGSHA